jgi:hypothetical protein
MLAIVRATVTLVPRPVRRAITVFRSLTNFWPAARGDRVRHASRASVRTGASDFRNSVTSSLNRSR